MDRQRHVWILMNPRNRWFVFCVLILAFFGLAFPNPNWSADHSESASQKRNMKTKLMVLRPEETIQSTHVSSLSPIFLEAQFMSPVFRHRPVLAEDGGRTKPLFLPLPALATNPNRGSEFGILPVVLFFDKDGSGRIENIFAPSVIFNTKTGFKGAVRWLGYLPKGIKYQLVAVQAIKVASDYLAQIEAPRIGEDSRFAGALGARYKRDPTEVFYGLGPDSREQDKSGMILSHLRFFLSLGVNFMEHFRLSYNERLRSAIIEDGGGSTDPFIGDTFPESLGVGTRDTFSARGISITFDQRDSENTPTEGYYGLVGLEFSQKALGSAESFTRIIGEAKAYIPWPSQQWVSAVRIFGGFVDNRNLPHYELSMLGGKDFRGFPSGRFVDRGVVLVNLEERIRVIRLEMLRVPFDVEAAPFVEFGQVFNDIEDIRLKQIQVSYGVGFRAVVRPNVIGKINVGAADEGLNVRVGLDYPF